MTFGEKLSKLRKEKNYTQEQLAEILNVSRQSVSKWEQNIAYPETDKLIRLARLFQCSIDYLLMDDDSKNLSIENNQNASQNVSNDTEQQKIIGYVLLAISFLSAVLILILSESIEELYIPLPFAIAALVCGFICMFVKQKVWYWCVWTMIIPLVSLSPHIVGLPLFSSTTVLLAIFVIIMIFVARKVFVDVKVTTGKKKSILIITCWIVVIGLRICSFGFTLSSTCDFYRSLPPYMFVSLILYVFVALLTTYTVCYVKSLK